MTAYVLGACMLVVLIILGLVLARAPAVPPAIPATPDTPITTAEPEPVAKAPRTSIGWLFNNQSLSSGTSVAVTGYLRSTKDPAQSKYVRTIADDAGLAVILTNLKGSQPDLFKNDDKIYTVYGVLRIYSGVAQIEVKSIEPALYPTS